MFWRLARTRLADERLTPVWIAVALPAVIVRMPLRAKEATPTTWSALPETETAFTPVPVLETPRTPVFVPDVPWTPVDASLSPHTPAMVPVSRPLIAAHTP